MDLDPIILSIPLYFLLIAIELIIQWVSKRKIYRLNDAITNISCGSTQQFTGIFLKVLAVVAYVFIYEQLRFFTIPVNVVSIIALFLLIDLAYYWAHRMSHEINLFWGGHVVHHQSEDYNFSVALRQSSLQVIWTFPFYLPLAFLGFDPETFVLLAALNTVYQFWIHTETIGKLGFLEIFLNTPSHHRVHHGRNPKYIDKNHAGVFIIWDKMFGTFQQEEERPTYGITTPSNSWNPLWVNISHYWQMGAHLKEAHNWGDRLRIMFHKPGWFPDYMGGFQAVQEVDQKAYAKYDQNSNKVLNTYVLFQFIFALAFIAIFLFTLDSLSNSTKLLGAGFLSLWLTNCGAILEGKGWGTLSETVKLISIPFVLPLFIPFSSPYFLWIIIGFAVVSFLWLFYGRYSTNKNENKNKLPFST